MSVEQGVCGGRGFILLLKRDDRLRRGYVKTLVVVLRTRFGDVRGMEHVLFA